MSEYIYKLNTGATLPRDIWQDASEGELRALVYLMTTADGATAKEVAEACGTSPARAKSALALWREAGIVTKGTPTAEKSARGDAPSVSLEFPERHVEGVEEIASLDAARTIRNEDLAELMADVATLLSKPTLNTYEAKHVTAAYEQYGVSAEYVITLATYLSEQAAQKGNKFTTKMLADKVSHLVGSNVDTLEALEAWIESSSRGGRFYELRRIFMIWSRNLTKSELKYFGEWTDELGYGVEIIDEARDVAVNSTGKQSLPYINKLLRAWHEGGVKTLGDLDNYRERQRMEKAASDAAAQKPAAKRGGKKTVEVPQYSEFNAEEAMLRALERSYRDEDN